MDPRIRIHTKMLRIRNTDIYEKYYTSSVSQSIGQANSKKTITTGISKKILEVQFVESSLKDFQLSLTIQTRRLSTKLEQ